MSDASILIVGAGPTGLNLALRLARDGVPFRITAVIARDGAEERCRFDYLCGCDGARSAVREGLEVGFGGGTYSHLYYVADVKLAHPDEGHDFHLAMGPDTFALRLPARRGQMERLIGFAPDGVEQPTFDDIKPHAERLLQTEIAELNWFSTYRVHHRVADRFRVGRAFLLGDAGHLHSPVGGQGMNTGIGDAANLAWKLSEVTKKLASPALLDTYEPERIAFARDLVATTDRMFQMVVSEGLSGKLFRTIVMPTAVPLATAFRAGRRTLFRLASQIAIQYPDSALSGGKAGEVRGGDRLPWVPSLNNFEPLRQRGWQIHVYGEPAHELTQLAGERAIPLHTLDFVDEAKQAGLLRNGSYLIRPDGYVGLAMGKEPARSLEHYLANH